VTDTHISPEMAAAVGRPLSAGRDSFPIDASDIRRWAIAVYYPEPPPRLFWDAAYAAGTTHGGIVAPEEFNPFAWTPPDRAPARTGGGDAPDPNYLERSLGLDPPSTRFMLNGGVSASYGVRMRPGDVITSSTSLAGYRERPGRLGLMLFSTTADEWTNQDGELVKRSEMTLIRY